MSTSATTAGEPEAIEIRESRTLQGKLGSVRRRLVLSQWIKRLGIFIVAAVAVLGLVMLFDWWFEFSMGTRTVLLVAGGILLAVLALRWLITPWSSRWDNETLALMVEQENPTFRSRLIASVQFGSGKSPVLTTGAKAMVMSMIGDATLRARGVNFAGVVDTSEAKGWGLSAFLLAALGVATFFLGGQLTSDLLKRVFLADIPVPRDTRVLSISGAVLIGVGDSVTIEAMAEGRLTDDAELEVEFESGRESTYSLSKDGSRYFVTIPNVPESFSCRAIVNDGVSKEYSVKAVARPLVTSVAGSQTYPKYTGREASTHKPGDFRLFPGSELKLLVTASKDVASGTIRLLGLEEESEVSLVANGAQLTGSLKVPSSGFKAFSVELVDRDGLATKTPPVFRVDLSRDDAPEVTIVYPTRTEVLSTATARFLIGFEAIDEFGISGVLVKYSINGGPLQELPLDLGGKHPKEVKRRYEWKLGEISPSIKEGDLVLYWIEARDVNTLTGPGVGESARLATRIVSVQEKREDLLNRATEAISGINRVTSDQEQLNKELGEIILDRNKDEDERE